MNPDYRTYCSRQSVNSGGDGRVWLRFLEFIDDRLHKPAPTDRILFSLAYYYPNSSIQDEKLLDRLNLPICLRLRSEHCLW
jgi:hypothetical protein